MFQRWAIRSLVAATLFTAQLSAGDERTTAPQESSCGEGPASSRISVRHIEANGVGYDQGYSTLAAFFMPVVPWSSAWAPFADLRGHAFNHGQPAANAGVGARYFSSRVWGGYGYYDYRQTRHHHYNQISAGLESLGRVWDFRINGYLPVGSTSTHSHKREFAMKGANAETGLHVDSFKNAPLYFAAGPYYLTGKGKTAWGGQARFAIDFFDYFRLEGNTSYDQVFKWIGQGQVSIIFPLVAKRPVRPKKASTCSKTLALSRRSVQPIDRNEIISIDRKRT